MNNLILCKDLERVQARVVACEQFVQKGHHFHWQIEFQSENLGLGFFDYSGLAKGMLHRSVTESHVESKFSGVHLRGGRVELTNEVIMSGNGIQCRMRNNGVESLAEVITGNTKFTIKACVRKVFRVFLTSNIDVKFRGVTIKFKESVLTDKWSYPWRLESRDSAVANLVLSSAELWAGIILPLFLVSELACTAVANR